MIDIIIPIYNAFEELVKCIESVRIHTEASDYRLILINDCSTDARIHDYIDRLKDNNIVVHENERNQGFSNNVNWGFEQSDENDVILLNSDTIVTANWLNKLVAVAYRNEEYGMVSPLSNSATICSVPNFCEDNELPNGYTIEQFGKLIEECSLKRYPIISVCVGFCMYIKRKVIKHVGKFDAKTYERGYGEEGDFCYRARLMGYRCVLADDTFVYHSGSASFLPENRLKLAQEHELILIKRYPELTDENRVFYTSNPINEIQDNIKLQLMLNNGRKNILYFSHRDFAENADDNIGGTQFHISDLKDSLKDKYNIFVLARDLAVLKLTLYIDDKSLSFSYYVGKSSEVPEFSNDRIKCVCEMVLKIFHISLVHIHHTKQLSLDMFHVAKSLEIPIIFTVHDYYSICPSLKLLDSKRKYCNTNCDESICRKCLAENSETDFYVPEFVHYIDNWRKKYLEAILCCEKIVFPSEAAANIFESIYKNIGDRRTVISHGISLPDTKQNKRKATHDIKQEIRVAFVGGLNEAKGTAVIKKMIMKATPGIRWYVIGGTNDADIRYLERKDYSFLDWYNRDKIVSTLDELEIDLVCILPIWPETFCYVMSEALIAGVPVLATDIGALSDRIDELECGWKVPMSVDASTIIKKIKSIQADGEEYYAIRQRTENITEKSVAKMGQEYFYLYEEYTGGISCGDCTYNFKNFFDEIEKSAFGNHSAESLRLERELSGIKNSYSYRFIEYMQKKRWPFKETVRNFIHKKFKR
ncbi:MAG: glycosyltransferase [Lachnospiraceae bacterium]|nr:glycosyltransferase [Lachnospiraceae bacterium]